MDKKVMMGESQCTCAHLTLLRLLYFVVVVVVEVG